MPYISPEDICRARQPDLLTFLQNDAPEKLVRLSANTYCTREHDSLKISNGKWHWFSRGIGGRTAMDYLIKVENMGFTQAVETILGRAAAMSSVFHAREPDRSKEISLPEPNKNNQTVTSYLKSRGIHPAIIHHCLQNRLLYESKSHHDAVFVGYDRDGVARYGNLRGTIGDFKGEVSGSDKRFSFQIPAGEASRTVHLFESAIDLLSFATLKQHAGQNWRLAHLLSLGGVSKAKERRCCPLHCNSS